MNQKRKFTPGFKKEAVALVLAQNYSIARAATSLGISAKTLRSWVAIERQRHESPLSEDEHADLRRLRRENKELRIEKEILKKASAFFAKHMS